MKLVTLYGYLRGVSVVNTGKVEEGSRCRILARSHGIDVNIINDKALLLSFGVNLGELVQEQLLDGAFHACDSLFQGYGSGMCS